MVVDIRLKPNTHWMPDFSLDNTASNGARRTQRINIIFTSFILFRNPCPFPLPSFVRRGKGR
jgi:hypothetical protein